MLGSPTPRQIGPWKLTYIRLCTSKKNWGVIPSDLRLRGGEGARRILSTTKSTIKRACIFDTSLSTNSQPPAKIWQLNHRAYFKFALEYKYRVLQLCLRMVFQQNFSRSVNPQHVIMQYSNVQYVQWIDWTYRTWYRPTELLSASVAYSNWR